MSELVWLRLVKLYISCLVHSVCLSISQSSGDWHVYLGLKQKLAKTVLEENNQTICQ